MIEAVAALDLHILLDKFHKHAEGYVQILRKLSDHGAVSDYVGEGITRLARLGNLILHK